MDLLHLEKLISENHDILKKQASKFANSTPTNIADFDDYYQEACLILFKVYDKYDPARGPWKNYLNSALNHELGKLASNWNSHLSVNTIAVKLSTQIFSLESQGYNVKEITEKLDISEQRYFEVRNILRRDILSDSVIEQPKEEIYLIIKEMFVHLNQDEAFLLNLALKEYNTVQISKILNVSHETARVRLKKLFAKLRNRLNEHR